MEATSKSESIFDLPTWYKNLNHYNRAIVWTLPCALILLGILLGVVSPELLQTWYLAIVNIPLFLGGMISGSTYVARNFDIFKDAKRRVELAGTVIGAVLGLAFIIALTILQEVVPFLKIFSYFAYAITALIYISAFAGVGNRIGCLFDKGKGENHRPKFEKVCLGTAGALGLILALTLFIKFTPLILGATGPLAIFTGGASIPVVLGGFIFVLMTVGAFMAFSDYGSKMVNLLRRYAGTNDNLDKHVRNNIHMYRGSMIGIMLGIAIAATVITVLVLHNPAIFAGAVGISLAVIYAIGIIGGTGGLCSRMGLWCGGLIKALGGGDVVTANIKSFGNKFKSFFLPKIAEKTQETAKKASETTPGDIMGNTHLVVSLNLENQLPAFSQKEENPSAASTVEAAKISAPPSVEPPPSSDERQLYPPEFQGSSKDTKDSATPADSLLTGTPSQNGFFHHPPSEGRTNPLPAPKIPTSSLSEPAKASLEQGLAAPYLQVACS